MKVLLLALMLVPMTSYAAVRIGVVNIQKVINTVKEGKRANDKVRASYKSKEKELKRDNEKIKKAEASFRKKAAILSAKERGKKQEELRKMITSFQEKSMKYQNQLRELKSKYEGPLVKKLRPVIEKISKSKKVDFTVEVSVPIVYAAQNVDLTDAIIKAYNKKHK